MVNISFVPGRTQEVMDKAATATPRKRVVEADDVALAVMACITHLKDTTGSGLSPSMLGGGTCRIGE